VTATVVAAVLMLSLLSVVTTLLGVALALRAGRSDRAIAQGLGFSVGVMILVSMLELLPEATERMGLVPALAIAALGMALVWGVRGLVPRVHRTAGEDAADAAQRRSAYLIVFGLLLHDVPEGFAMANSYVADPALGLLTGLAIALHNLPEEFAMAVPATAVRSKPLLYGSAALSALAEPAGAVVGLAAVGAAPSLNSAFLALAAGAMLFVSVHELVPMARRHGHGGSFAAGAVLSVLVYALLSRITTAAFASGVP
jgi:ZIP family zinc transporter